MGRRAWLSTLLFLGAATLLIAVSVGNGMGSRVVSQVAGRLPQFAPSDPPIPEPSATDAEAAVAWKHTQVMTVATDPAFPDPRVTPAPPPSPPPPKATPTPKPSATPRPNSAAPYTSPPLPIPLVSHSPDSAPASAEPAETGGVPPSP